MTKFLESSNKVLSYRSGNSAPGFACSANNHRPCAWGAVLVGFALALLIEAFLQPARMRGLGLGGAISINLCGAVILIIWLVGGKLDLPPRGNVFFWGLVVVLIGISAIESLAQFGIKKG